MKNVYVTESPDSKRDSVLPKRIPWNKGKRMPKSFGQKISASKMGHKHSEETKKKISKNRKGKCPPENNAWNRPDVKAKCLKAIKEGKGRTQEWRDKISQSIKKKYKEDPTYKYRTTRGRTFSEQGKKNIAEANRKRTRRGKDSNFWKGGVTKLTSRIRECSQYKEWRTKVYERDNYVCQQCGAKGHLNADHITPFSDVIYKNNIKTLEEARACKQLWDISNGRTLCFECHKKTDTFAKRSDLKYKKEKSNENWHGEYCQC